jgi:fatty-acyl-CoA synthase
LRLSYDAGPNRPPVRHLTLGAALAEAAAEVPDRVALVVGVPEASARREWTYGEFDADARRVARALLSRFEPGDRVAVWAPNVPEWALLEFGCASAGVVLVTVNPAYQAAELAYVLGHSRAKGLLTVDEFRGNPMLEIAERVRGECPELREVVRLAEWEQFLALAEGHDGPLPPCAPGDPVMIQYTSGTTGAPKGAVLNHRGLVTNGLHFFARMGMEPGGTYLTQMPLFHTAGSSMSMLGCVGMRCTQVLVERFDPGLVLELLETYAVNATLGVPTMYIALLEHPSFDSTDLSALRVVSAGGALVPESLVRSFQERAGVSFTIMYGQTECSPTALMNHTSDTVADKAGTIGTAMPNTEVKIADPVTGETLPVGGVGELCTRGYHVMLGYLDMPEQTAEAIDADGWLHTGDLAAMDERGYCTIEGRLKDMIIRGGENIYPREIEELLCAHPSVAEVAVVGLPDATWGESVAAFVRPVADASIERQALFDYLRAHLAPHKTPKHWFEVGQFPLTGSGKIQKYVLRERWQRGELAEL